MRRATNHRLGRRTGGPPLITILLIRLGGHEQRGYVFVYLAAVAGLIGGLWPALLAAAVSFLLVDYHAAHHDAKFAVVTVRTHALSDEEKEIVGSYAALTHQLRGEFLRLDARNIAETLARYIRETQATEVIIGHRNRARWLPWDTTTELIRLLSGVDVHILRARPAPVTVPLPAPAHNATSITSPLTES